jgi:hypothetical protein
MDSNYHYFIKTKTGVLELSKGAYLTMQKRKKTSITTLKKTKQIVHSCSTTKTLKKVHQTKICTNIGQK